VNDTNPGGRRPFLGRRSELRAIALARRQPESTSDLTALIQRERPRLVARILRDPAVRARLTGTRHRLVGIDYREAKPRGDLAEPDRLAEVGFFDYDHNTLVVAVADLRSGNVRHVDERVGVQPPLSDEELEDARRIIGSDKAYQRLARRSLSLSALPARAAFSEEHPAFGHRCFAVSAWSGRRAPKLKGTVLVDLSDRRLVPGEAEDLRPPDVGSQSRTD